MNHIRQMPEGFEKEAHLSQTILCRKYHAHTRTIRRWKQLAGKIRQEPGVCDYRYGIVCTEKHCKKCGWNPEEEKKIRAILHDGGIKAVRKYITARDIPPILAGNKKEGMA